MSKPQAVTAGTASPANTGQWTKDNPPPNVWKPGQSGNPSGRPKATVPRAQLRDAAMELARQMQSQSDPELLASQAAAFQVLADRGGLEPDSVALRAFAAVLEVLKDAPELRRRAVVAWLREHGETDDQPAIEAKKPEERPAADPELARVEAAESECP